LANYLSLSSIYDDNLALISKDLLILATGLGFCTETGFTNSEVSFTSLDGSLTSDFEITF